MLFAVFAMGGFALAQRVPFNPLEVIWDPRSAAPSRADLSAPGAAILRRRDSNRTGLHSSMANRIAAIYRADLIGAASGALLIIAVLYALPPQDCLRVVGGLGVIAASLAVWASKRRRWAAGIAALAVISAALWPQLVAGAATVALQGHEHRADSARCAGFGRAVESDSNMLTVVESPVIPFRHAPGLSLSAATEPPPQLGVFTDADGLSTITRFTGDRSALSYLDQQTAALPYHLLERPRTLVLGAGGGADVLRALYHQAAHIDAVELNPDLVDLVRGEFSGFAGRIYERPDVTVAHRRGPQLRRSERRRAGT